jgi:hypothetical protein
MQDLFNFLDKFSFKSLEDIEKAILSFWDANIENFSISLEDYEDASQIARAYAREKGFILD